MSSPSLPTRDSAEIRVFLQDILENPGDDTPRLILADWLADHDHPWGELLRAQTWRKRRADHDPEYDQLREQEREWLDKYGDSIFQPFRDLGFRARFERGMIHLIGPIDVLFDPGLDQLTKEDVWSWVEMARIVGMGGMIPNLATVSDECSQLRYFVGLDLESTALGVAGVSQLVLSEHLCNLLRLELGFNGLVSDSASAIAAAPCLSNLRRLGLDDNYIGPDGIEHLVAEDSELENLHTLDLRFNNIRLSGAARLAESALPNLTTVYLGNNRIGNEGAQALVEGEGLAKLSTLYVEHNGIDSYWLGALRERFGPNVYA